jgi:predicted RNase H-like nuclease (RuvC/YqgF family)
MSSIGKVFVVLNLVFSLVILGVVGAILSKSEEYRLLYTDEQTAHLKTRTDAEQLQSDLQADNNSKGAEIARLQDDLSNMDAQNKNLQRENETLTVDNQNLRDAVDKLQASYTAFTTQFTEINASKDALVASNADLTAQRAAAEDAKNAAEADKLRLEATVETQNKKIEELGAQIEELSGMNNDLNAQLEAASQMGFDLAKVRALPKIDGVVRHVNRDMELVVLSVGADDGVVRGAKFEIYGENYKGQVVIDDVYPDNSSGRIVREAPGETISVMDSATTRL